MWKLLRPDAEKVLHDSLAQEYLERYYDILNEKKIANYLIMKRLGAEVSDTRNLPNLWEIHSELQDEFIKLRKKVDNKQVKFEDLKIPEYSYLDLKIDIARIILSDCHFCERNCRIDRIKGDLGYCKIDTTPYISSVHLHYGEEAPLIPSGTIFFCGCTFSCVFCQNSDISSDPRNGIEMSSKKLAQQANYLKKHEQARNINYVSPLAHTAAIIESLKHQTENVAQLWNSNHYCSLDTMYLINDLMDFWLPDFKYGNDDCALKYSNVKNYFTVLTRNLKMNYEHFGEEESKNTIIRILVLPNHLECCMFPILEWIADNIPKVLINIMAQYRPSYKVPRNNQYKEINRRPSQDEMIKVRKRATELGLAWKQVS